MAEMPGARRSRIVTIALLAIGTALAPSVDRLVTVVRWVAIFRIRPARPAPGGTLQVCELPELPKHLGGLTFRAELAEVREEPVCAGYVFGDLGTEFVGTAEFRFLAKSFPEMDFDSLRIYVL